MTWPAHPEICWDKPSEDNCYEFMESNCKGHPGKPCTGGYGSFYSSGFTIDRVDFQHTSHNATYKCKESLWEKLRFLIPDFGFDSKRKTEIIKNSVSLFISIKGYWIGIWW